MVFGVAYSLGVPGSHISWLENLDGRGSLGTERTVVADVLPSAVITADFDGDGDLDVGVVKIQGPVERAIAWYENLDGAGSFGSERSSPVSSQRPLGRLATRTSTGTVTSIVSAGCVYETRSPGTKTSTARGAFGPQRSDDA